MRGTPAAHGAHPAPRLREVLRRGLRVSCPSTEAGRCTVTVTVTAAAARRLKLSVPRRAKTATTAVRAALVASDAAGNRGARNLTATIRR